VRHEHSRKLDPQLHDHCLIANLVGREDGEFVGLDSRNLFRAMSAARCLYDNELRHQLTQRLGYRWQEVSTERVGTAGGERAKAFGVATSRAFAMTRFRSSPSAGAR
jgi:conjugative relaxase-like TrwC/TraI family protein